jgi:hypothetical protein
VADSGDHSDLSERSDWTEQDLLTRDEAVGRVRIEIELVRSQLAELLADADPALRPALEKRLRSLVQFSGDLPPA